MTRRWSWVSLFGVLAAFAACDGEVTLRLLQPTAELGTGGTVADAGAAGESAAGEGGTAGSVADAGAAGDDTAPNPCHTIGPEVCNGGDDDCNGQVDEGCEYTLKWKNGPDGATLGHDVGGFAFVEPCGDGSLLAGLRFGMGKWLNQVSAICRQIELLVDDTQSPSAYSITVSASRVLQPYAPSGTTDMDNKTIDQMCPEDWVVSGISGVIAPDDRKYVNGVTFSCAPVGVNAAGQLELDLGQQTTFPITICASCTSGAEFDFTASTPAKHVPNRIFGGVGLWVDRFGLGYAQATVAPR